jgi:prepilin-type N-terminal cleavage/methylation domain-containing protein
MVRAQVRDGRGFTLVEVLVVIAIIGLLLALLLPAVQAARESARRTECKNHIKQFAVASHHHLDVTGYFPSGGWGLFWVGDPDRGYGHKQPGGWTFSILPFMEQQPLFQTGLGLSGQAKLEAAGAVNTNPVPLFYCPSRRDARLYPFVNFPGDFVAYNCIPLPMSSRLDYAANCGDSGTNEIGGGPQSLQEGDTTYPWPDTTNLTGPSFLRSEVHVSDIRDGTSFTYLIGEKYINPDDYGTGKDPGDDQPIFLGYDNDSDRTTALVNVPKQDQRGLRDYLCFGSAHAVAFQMSFCDGSVRAINYTIDPEVNRRLGNRSDMLAVTNTDF